MVTTSLKVVGRTDKTIRLQLLLNGEVIGEVQAPKTNFADVSDRWLGDEYTMADDKYEGISVDNTDIFDHANAEHDE
jgi:hypothetical protein